MNKCSVCAVIICNFKLFILYCYTVSLFISQGVVGGSYLGVEDSTEQPRQKLWFHVFPNYQLKPVVFIRPRYEVQSSNTISVLPSSSPQTERPNKRKKNRIWIHSFLIPSDWSKYLPNNRNEEQRLNTRQDNLENVTRPFEVSDSNSGTRTPSNNNLPRIISIPTLPLWPGENNGSDVPKSDYEKHDFSHVREPSGIGGSRIGMAELSGLEGDDKNTSNKWMRKENTHPSEEGSQKLRIHYFPSYIGWSEDKSENSSGTNMQLSSSTPRTERTKPKLWFATSLALPAWSENAQNSGHNEQRLDTSNQENQSSQGSRMSGVVSTRPIRAVGYDSSSRVQTSGLESDLPKFESNPTQHMCSDKNNCSHYKTNDLFNHSKNYEGSVPENQNNTLGFRYIAGIPAEIQGSRQGMSQLKGLEGSRDGVNSSRINYIRYFPIWSNDSEREKHRFFRFTNHQLWPGNIQNFPIPSSVSNSQSQTEERMNEQSRKNSFQMKNQTRHKPEFAIIWTPKAWTGRSMA